MSNTSQTVGSSIANNTYDSNGTLTSSSTSYAQPLNFRNENNTSTFATLLASKQYSGSIPSNSGILDITGQTTSSPCFLKNGRLLPLVNTSNATSLTLDLSSNNNHHLTTTSNIATINLTNPIIGQSGHLVIKNSNANTHSITWQIGGGNTGYIKWQGGSAPTMSTASGSYDIVSYYCYSTTEILLASSTGHS